MLFQRQHPRPTSTSSSRGSAGERERLGTRYVPQKVPTKFNPLNAIQQESDSTDTNGPGSPQAYTDWADGLRATVVTLLADDYGYPAIVTALKKGNQPIAVYEAVVASNWTKQDFYSWYGQGYVYKQPPWNQP